MHKTLMTLSAGLAACFAAGGAQAQDWNVALLAPAAPAAEKAERVERSVEIALHRAGEPLHLALGDGALGFAGREMEGERVVKGAPYCATAVHETVQALMDGNRIVKKQSTHLCRDGEGRTRRELQREGAPRVVYLHDPVAKESWVLDPEKKTARKLRSVNYLFHGSPTPGATGAPGAPGTRLDIRMEPRMGELSEHMRQQAERWREWAGQVADRAREQVRERVVERAGEPGAKADGRGDGKGDGRGDVRVEVKTLKDGEPGVVVEHEVLVRTPGASEPQRHREVRVIRMGDFPHMAPLPPVPPVPPLPPLPPVPGFSVGHGFPLPLPRGDGVSTALPVKDIEGVKVNGERTTWTIEAGKIGNEKPIVISREVWRSPELMLTVMSRDSDPRSGEVSYRLEKIRRGEPDAALMKVPADYSDTRNDTRRVPRQPPPPSSGAKGS